MGLNNYIYEWIESLQFACVDFALYYGTKWTRSFCIYLAHTQRPNPSLVGHFKFQSGLTLHIYSKQLLSISKWKSSHTGLALFLTGLRLLQVYWSFMALNMNNTNVFCGQYSFFLNSLVKGDHFSELTLELFYDLITCLQFRQLTSFKNGIFHKY